MAKTGLSFGVWIKPGFRVWQIRVWGFSLWGLDQNRVCGLANPGLKFDKSGFRVWDLVNPSLHGVGQFGVWITTGFGVLTVWGLAVWCLDHNWIWGLGTSNIFLKFHTTKMIKVRFGRQSIAFCFFFLKNNISNPRSLQKKWGLGFEILALTPIPVRGFRKTFALWGFRMFVLRLGFGFS